MEEILLRTNKQFQEEKSDKFDSFLNFEYLWKKFKT